MSTSFPARSLISQIFYGKISSPRKKIQRRIQATRCQFRCGWNTKLIIIHHLPYCRIRKHHSHCYSRLDSSQIAKSSSYYRKSPKERCCKNPCNFIMFLIFLDTWCRCAYHLRNISNLGNSINLQILLKYSAIPFDSLVILKTDFLKFGL